MSSSSEEEIAPRRACAIPHKGLTTSLLLKADNAPINIIGEERGDLPPNLRGSGHHGFKHEEYNKAKHGHATTPLANTSSRTANTLLFTSKGATSSGRK